MKYMLLTTFTDLADERPRVVVSFIEADSEAGAGVIAVEIAEDASTSDMPPDLY